ncbi:MAG: right-handed parallel beta-helix repeat-containing protein [Methylocella sp.]
MAKITSLPIIAGALLACGLSAAPAAALANRTFVSGKGTDAGACAYVAPCRSFAFALTQTNSGGEIDVLDPAGYGTVTITKAISIVNDGVGLAAIAAPSGNAITINAGAGNSVHLRGLTIDGFGSGSNGIVFATGGNLAIENCVVRGFTGAGINIRPTGSAVVTGVFSNVTTNNNLEGIFVSGLFTTGGSVNVTIVDSEASNNADNGVEAISAPGAAATAVMVRNSVASYNGVGLSVGVTGILRIAHSVVTGNNSGLNMFVGSIINSYGDNDIDGNTNNNTGVLTVIPTH